RLRLTLGVLSLAALPALFVLAIAVALPNAHPTEWIRLDPLQRAGIWLQRFGSVPPGTTAAERAVSAVDTGNLLKNYVVTIARGFDPLVALLLPASLIGWRGLWLRRDVIPLILLAACVLFSSWIHLSFAHLMSSRYALPAFLALSPLCALGMV